MSGIIVKRKVLCRIQKLSTVVREGVITMSVTETVGSVKFIFVIVTEISIMNIVSP